MDEESDITRNVYADADGYESLGVVALQLLTLPIWLPVWLYVRLVHQRPSRCIRQRFTSDFPSEELLGLQIEKTVGQRVFGRLTLSSGELPTFEYHRDLDVLTVYRNRT